MSRTPRQRPRQRHEWLVGPKAVSFRRAGGLRVPERLEATGRPRAMARNRRAGSNPVPERPLVTSRRAAGTPLPLSRAASLLGLGVGAIDQPVVDDGATARAAAAASCAACAAMLVMTLSMPATPLLGSSEPWVLANVATPAPGRSGRATGVRGRRLCRALADAHREAGAPRGLRGARAWLRCPSRATPLSAAPFRTGAFEEHFKFRSFQHHETKNLSGRMPS